MSIRAQCFGPLMRERRRKISPDPLPASSEWSLDDLETLVDHITRFSLAGIQEIRTWMETTSSAKQHA
jgi:hypothetical protein